jgi:hypothetical protein
MVHWWVLVQCGRCWGGREVPLQWVPVPYLTMMVSLVVVFTNVGRFYFIVRTVGSGFHMPLLERTRFSQRLLLKASENQLGYQNLKFSLISRFSNVLVLTNYHIHATFPNFYLAVQVLTQWYNELIVHK